MLYATAEDPPYVVGKPVVIKATIQNIGKSDVTDDFYVELREKGVPLCNETISGLNANDTKEVVLEWTPLTPGEHNLFVDVDPSPGIIPESNSLNNSWGPLRVEVEDNRPDLVASIIAPSTIHKGVEVTIEANISNIGYETNKSFWVRFCVDDVAEDGRYMTLDNDTQSNITNFNWIASDIGNYNLSVEANPRNTDKGTINESDWSNNIVFQEVVVTQPTPTPTPSPGVGPGGGGGGGGGSAGGFGAGSGTGESGSGETGGMQMPINVSTSAAAEETKKEVSGYPFGNMSSGASGGGGTIPILLVVVAVFIMTIFYFGYYKEKKSHAKHISQGNEIKEGRRTNNKK